MSRVALFGGIGGGNASPVYQPELFRFDGVKPLPSTAARTVPRGRQLEHPGHTPAVRLEGRYVPDMEQWQIPAFPQIICFDLDATTNAATILTSAPITTPSIIKEMLLRVQAGSNPIETQVCLSNTIIDTDAQFEAMPLIFKLAPANQTHIDPLTITGGSFSTGEWQMKLNMPLPNGPRNRIAIRIFNTDQATAWLVHYEFRIEPL